MHEPTDPGPTLDPELDRPARAGDNAGPVARALDGHSAQLLLLWPQLSWLW
jgi:hypothetical protein